MQIGGFQPFTLSDFPGRSAAIVFTRGCNFRCPFCHNVSLWPRSANERQTSRDVLAFLEKRRGLLDGVVVSGGEPTLHDDLAAFIRDIRTLGFAVKLDTNGSRSEVLRNLLEAGLLDYVAMDIKAPSAYYGRLSGVDVDMSAIRRSIRLIADSSVEHHFRTTWVAPLLQESDRSEILELVPDGSRHVWQKFRPQLAADVALQRSA